MAQSKVQSQIPWSDDLSILQRALYSLFAPVLSTQHVSIVFSGEAMVQYWVPACTHKSVSPENYEKFEFDGDLRLSPQFIKYLKNRFGVRLTPSQGTYFLGSYMSKKYQAQLSRQLGLDRLVRYDITVEKATTDIEEDVFESVMGCLGSLVDEKIQDGLGDIYIYNFLTEIFNKIPLSLDEVTRDSVSLLKELYDKKRWGEVRYVYEKSDRPELGIEKVTVRDPNGGITGTGYGNRTEAEGKAAADALVKLESMGITRASADQEQLESKRRQNPMYEQQYKRAQQALEKLNAQSAASGKPQALEFKITSAGNTKSGNNTIYTYTLDLAYPKTDGSLQWRTTLQETGLDQSGTQINLMKLFADRMQIK